jgi:hypothetical protein
MSRRRKQGQARQPGAAPVPSGVDAEDALAHARADAEADHGLDGDDLPPESVDQDANGVDEPNRGDQTDGDGPAAVQDGPEDASPLAAQPEHAQDPGEPVTGDVAEQHQEATQEPAGEPEAAGDAAMSGPPADGQPAPPEGPETAAHEPAASPWADLAARLSDGDGLIVPTPAVGQPPIVRFVEDPPAPAATTRPAPRRGHRYARVCGPGTLMATGYTLDGEQRSRWQAGEEGQFHRRDIESRPDCFEERP